MKQYLLATTVCLLPFAASAADMPLKAPVPFMQPVPFSWTGLYIGASGGMIAQTTRATDLGDPFGVSFWDTVGDRYGIPGNGGIFGVNIGYNFQFGGIVLGIEADISGTSINDTLVHDGLGLSSRLNNLGTVRGRLGYAFDHALFYVTGGWASGEVKNRAFDVTDPSYFSATTGRRTGTAFGGGLEYAVTNNWTVRAEALFVDLGSVRGSASTSGCRFGFKNKYSIGRVGANYKF
jgi:outer membrane immunogenic protein